MARAWLVREGLLYGTDRILGTDVLISALLVLGLVLMRYFVRRDKSKGKDKGGGSGETPTWTDWFGFAATLLGLPALVVSLLTLVAPATPNAYGARACAAAQVYSANYVGLTVGPLGNYARSGPGVAFSQTDRFDSGCTLGFEGYCVGDAIKDPVAPKGWTETRWLLVARHDEGWGRTVARVLSDEPEHKRFVSLSYVAPKSPEQNLKYLGDEACEGGRARPGPVVMTSQPAGGGVEFTMETTHTERVGVAIALPDNAIRGGSAIRQVGSKETEANGTVSITWNTQSTLPQLTPKRSEPVRVVALAAPCLGPVGSADVESTATVTYAIAADGAVTVVPDAPAASDDLRDKLRRAACDTERSGAL
ncbi:hypothetical protein [Lentzea fradiae]|uniref:hypothetical protein n=1 Tax=Lentzea fradiae TaxID=200378 RepID=UPI000B7E40E5|nr:hypothetical protein [Lentzea fradiae]